MKIYGLIQWTERTDYGSCDYWLPDFDTVELFTDEAERDKRLLELDGPELINALNNLKERWGMDDEYIDFEESIRHYEWHGYHPERRPFSFHNIKGEPVKDGPYVPFSKETGPVGKFWWQINAHFYQDGEIENYFLDACDSAKK